MKLTDLTFPINHQEASQYALVFSELLANKISEIQLIHGPANCRLSPLLLSNGKFMLYADILTEINSGGLLYSTWLSIDQEILNNDVEVFLLSDVLSLIVEQEIRPEYS